MLRSTQFSFVYEILKLLIRRRKTHVDNNERPPVLKDPKLKPAEVENHACALHKQHAVLVTDF